MSPVSNASSQASLASLYQQQSSAKTSTPAQIQAVAANPVEPVRDTQRSEAAEPRRDGDERMGGRINTYA